MVGCRLARDYMAVKLADCTAVDLIGLEMLLVSWLLAD
jgi:hypothetical protein